MIARGMSSTIQRISSAVLLRMPAAASSPAVSPGGRHVGECMSLAMTWAYPERSSWRRRAQRPRPVLAGDAPGGELKQRAAADDLPHAVGRRLHRLGALRVGDDGAEAAHLEGGQEGGKLQRPPLEGHLDQEPSPAAAERRGAELVLVHQAGLLDRDLEPGHQSHVDPGRVDRGLQRGDALRYPLGGVGVLRERCGVQAITRTPSAAARRAISTESSSRDGPSSTRGRVCECRSITTTQAVTPTRAVPGPAPWSAARAPARISIPSGL